MTESADRRVRLCIATGLLTLGTPLLAQDHTDSMPSGPEHIVEVLSPFLGPPDSAKVAELLRNEGAESGFPTSDHDRVLVARLWRLAGQPGLAVESLTPIAPESEAASLGLYELAKIRFESGDSRRGIAAYDAACRVADESLREQLAWDLLAISTPEEREAWPWSGPAPSDPCANLGDFWDQRALRAATSRDQRIAEHYRRLASARSKFYLKRPRNVEAMSDAYGRPEGLALDDRGLLLVRLGQPDYQQACPEEVVDQRVGVVDDERNLLGVCWAYWRPEGYKLFYLSTRDRFGREWPYGDYRIQENLSQQAEPGSEYFHKYVMNADLPPETKNLLVRRGPVFRNRKLALAGAATSIDDQLTGDLNSAEALALRGDARDETRRQTAEVLESIPDAPEIESTLTLRFEPLRFLNPASGDWHVWLLSSVRAGDLASTESGEGAIGVEGRVVTMLDARLSMLPLPPVTVPSASVPDDAGIPIRGVLTAEPGPLPVTVVVEDLSAPGTGAWLQDTIQIPRVGGLPQLSDIAVAQSEGGTWTRDGVTFLNVSPAHITNPDGSIHTYFEVYGIRAGTEYEVELRLVPTEAGERIWRLDLDDLAFRLQFNSRMPGPIGRHHLELDLSDAEPGAYVLAVRVQVKGSGAYSLPSVTDLFVGERE